MARFRCSELLVAVAMAAMLSTALAAMANPSVLQERAEQGDGLYGAVQRRLTEPDPSFVEEFASRTQRQTSRTRRFMRRAEGELPHPPTDPFEGPTPRFAVPQQQRLVSHARSEDAPSFDAREDVPEVFKNAAHLPHVPTVGEEMRFRSTLPTAKAILHQVAHQQASGVMQRQLLDGPPPSMPAGFLSEDEQAQMVARGQNPTPVVHGDVLPRSSLVQEVAIALPTNAPVEAPYIITSDKPEVHKMPAPLPDMPSFAFDSQRRDHEVDDGLPRFRSVQQHKAASALPSAPVMPKFPPPPSAVY